jgi:hypothetical protein
MLVSRGCPACFLGGTAWGEDGLMCASQLVCDRLGPRAGPVGGAGGATAAAGECTAAGQG